MRKFNIRGLENIEVDLDDDSTYSHLPKKAEPLRNLMFQEIGCAHCYMDYFHPDVFGNDNLDGGQKKRVELLIKDFCDNESQHRGDTKWLREKVFIFQCEIENMC
jgi:hypothetical protein